MIDHVDPSLPVTPALKSCPAAAEEILTVVAAAAVAGLKSFCITLAGAGWSLRYTPLGPPTTPGRPLFMGLAFKGQNGLRKLS